MIGVDHNCRTILEQKNAFQLICGRTRQILLCRQNKRILRREEAQRQLVQIQIGAGQRILRACLRKFRNEIHPQIGGGGGDPDVLSLLDRMAQHLFFAALQGIKHLIDIPKENLTLGIEHNALGIAVKQLHTQFLFQAGDRIAQGRRRDIERFRSRRNFPQLRYGFKIFQLQQFHSVHLTPKSRCFHYIRQPPKIQALCRWQLVVSPAKQVC